MFDNMCAISKSQSATVGWSAAPTAMLEKHATMGKAIEGARQTYQDSNVLERCCVEKTDRMPATPTSYY
jgi:hypothetical protein